MGWELHITRAECWADNEEKQISSDEWLHVINEDETLSIDEKSGEFHAIWYGESTYDEQWLEWSSGNISTKNPDNALYCKMLEIAKKLKAKVVDDDDRVYSLPEDLDNPSWAQSNNAPKSTHSTFKKIINAIAQWKKN